MNVKVKVWRHENQVLVRNDKYHINTFGDTLEEALENFKEALEMNLEDEKLGSDKVNIVLSYPMQTRIRARAVKAV